MMNRCFAIFLALLCLGVSFTTQAEKPAVTYTLGALEAQPGTTVSGYLEVPAGVDAGSRIPVSIIHGVHPGPTLALIAGTHGYEYPPITALQRLRKELDPATLSGTVILIHVANPPSFLGRTIYTSPVDGKNLNRVYPGKTDGTVSECIAHVITTQVIERADYLVDMHGGDGNEILRPYIYMPVTGDAELDAKIKGMALAFGLDHIVIDPGRLADPAASVFTDMTGLTRGVAAITTETGQMGSNDDYWVDMAQDGVMNLLRHLKMIDEDEIPNTGVVWLEDYQVIRASSTGVFHASVRDGYMVAEGTLLGVLMNLFGEPVMEIRAPFAGVVNYVVGTPPVSEGEPLAMISRVAK
jgi:predicted deacylase